MKFFEYHVHPEIEPEKMVGFSKLLGWSGLCFIFSHKKIREMEKFKNDMKNLKEKCEDIDISFGIKIENEEPGEIKRLARGLRKKAEFILVHGGNLEINRVAVETPEVDILTHPELGREDSGLDQTTAKLARENNVAIELNFRGLLFSYRKSRIDLFSKLAKNARLVRKYKTPFILTSGALSPWDLRSPSELISFGRLLGFRDPEIKKALSDKLFFENRKRLSGKWIMPGVEIE